MKKADIWISAVIYMGVGIAILSIVLAIGIPVINRIKDKNTAIETEELMLSLDEKIRAVYNEGPGSRRPFKFDLNKGSLEIDAQVDIIKWNFDTSVLLSEPDVEIRQGNLVVFTQDTGIKDQYTTSFILNYTNILDITLDAPSSSFSGSNNLLVTNIGSLNQSLPNILITSV